MLQTEGNEQRIAWAETMVKLIEADIKELEDEIPLYGWTSRHKNMLKHKQERLAHFQELTKD